MERAAGDSDAAALHEPCATPYPPALRLLATAHALALLFGAAAHMRENLDVFNWQLSDNDMHALSHSASAHPPLVLFSAV